MRKLNVRLAAILLVAGLAFFLIVEGIPGLSGPWGLWGGLHGFMVRRNAGFFLRQAEEAMHRAEQAEATGSPDKELLAYEEAAKYYGWYLRLRPNEHDVRERLGLLQADLFRLTLATGPQDTASARRETRGKATDWLKRAMGTLERVIRTDQDSDHPVARRRLVDIYLLTEGYSDAEAHLTALLEQAPANSELLELLGQCQAAVRQFDQAATTYQQAIQSAPDQVSAYQRLAALLMSRDRLNRPAEADLLMQEMMEANPDSIPAHLAYGSHLAGLTRLSSFDEVTKRPMFLDAMVPAVLAEAVDQAVQEHEWGDDDPDALLLAESQQGLAQVVQAALKEFDATLALEDAGQLLLAAVRGRQVGAPDPTALARARDRAIENLSSEEAPEPDDALAVAVGHGVLVDAMQRVLVMLRDPGALMRTVRDGLLENALQHAMKARELAVPDRDALASLFLSELSPEDHEAIRLATERGILLATLKRARAIEARDRTGEVPPTLLGRIGRRAILVDAMETETEALGLSDDQKLVLANGHGVLVDVLRHVLRNREPASADWDLLLQADGVGVMARTVQEALAAEQGIMAEALRSIWNVEDTSLVLSLTVAPEVLADALERAIEAAELPEEERSMLLAAAERGVLADALRSALRDPDLTSSGRDRLLQSTGAPVFPRVAKRAIQAAQWDLEASDRTALLLASQCALLKGEYGRARAYIEQGIELYPSEPQMYTMAAEVASRAGLEEDALAALERGLKATGSPDLIWARARALIEAGMLLEARDSIRTLRKIGHSDPLVGFLQARTEYELGHWLAAIEGRNGALLFSGRSELKGALDSRLVSADVRRAFEDHGISLSDGPIVSIETEDEWTIIDRDAVYEIALRGSSLDVYREATQGFEDIRGGLAPSPQLLKETNYWIARCYGYLENTDQESKAYRRALDIDPFYFPARAGLAAALAKSGQYDEAVGEYQQLMQAGADVETVWFPLAQLLFNKCRRLPPSERNWSEVEYALNQVTGAERSSVRFTLLQTEVLIIQAEEQRLLARQGDSPAEQQQLLALTRELYAKAERLLRDALNRTPDEAEYWVVLSQLAQRNQEWDQAVALLEEAEQQLGDHAVLRLGRAAYLLDRYGEDCRDQLRELAEDTERFSQAEQVQLWFGLLSASERVGDYEQCRRLCRWVAEKEPTDLRARRTLLQLAFRSGSDAGIRETLEEVERIEGKGPLWLYGEAVRLMLLAEEGDDKLLDEALGHLAEARALRPSWSRIPLLVATIYDRRGNQAAALENYLQAIDLGDASPIAVRRGVELLYREQRFAEASRLLSVFEEIPPELLRTASRIDLGMGSFQQALAKAEQTVANSDDYRDYIWLSQLLTEKGRLAVTGERTEEARSAFSRAEATLEQARELAEDVPEVWVNTVRFFVTTAQMMGSEGVRQMKKAENAIEQIRSKVPPDLRSLALAEAYELMRRLDLAEENCEEAMAAAPEDPTVARYVTNFYLRIGEYPEADAAQRSRAIVRAESILKRITDGEMESSEEDVAWARRRLAFIALARGGYQNRQEALELIEQNLATTEPRAEDLRYKANILFADGSPESREQATKILKGLPSGTREATPQDRFMLWQLYLAEGNWSEANAQMRSLLAAPGDQPVYVAAYAAALLDRGQPQEADAWLTLLEKIAPNFLSTVSLRAESLFQRGKYRESLDLMSRFVGRPGAQPADEAERCRAVALALEGFAQRLADLGEEEMGKQFLADTEWLCQKYVRQRPGKEWFLVLFLERQGRIDEALRLLKSSWLDSDPVATAEACLSLLRNSATTQAQRDQVETIVLEALDRFDRPVPLLLVLAHARSSQERYREAETVYREIIKKDSSAYRAMNNLAVLLALQKSKLKEALDYVNRAIEVVGPIGPVLDSRATVYMALGQPNKALDDLAKAIDEGATPTRLFHQAQAYRQSGQQQAAIDAMEKAREMGLNGEMLEPLERPAYRTLLRMLQ